MFLIIDLLFFLALAGLVSHELDAVHNREWRLLYVLRGMEEGAARSAFILLHVPLLALLFWLVAHPQASVREASRIGIDLFLVIHAALHWRLRGDANYQFHSTTSRLLIFGSAAVALLHMILRLG